MGTFVQIENDGYNPEFGEINWKRRLNMALEENDATMMAIGYVEKPNPVMQITQNNLIVYINQVADELDCMAIQYEPDGQDVWTWYFRHMFEEQGESRFMEIVEHVGQLATQIISLYPMQHVVTQYNKMQDRQIPDSIPENFGV